MTIRELLNECKEMFGGYAQANDSRIVSWVSELDFKVRNDIYRNYTLDEGHDFSGYRNSDGDISDIELLIADGYTDIYLNFISSKLDLIDGDVDKYQGDMILFNASWDNFVNYYNRTHIYKSDGGLN